MPQTSCPTSASLPHALGRGAAAFPRLHVLTDTRGGRDPLPDVRAALRAGAGAIQVRAKEHTDREAVALTRATLSMAAEYAALVLVDDRLDVALVAGAHGVHLGEHDLAVADVRAVAPAGFVIGGTARTPSVARELERAGATYLGVGPVAATSTKTGLPDPLGPAGVAAVCAATTLPVVAIGGVAPEGVCALLEAGCHGVAVVSAVSQAADPGAATAAFLARLAVRS